MEDESRSREQLIEELVCLRQQVSRLQAAESSSMGEGGWTLQQTREKLLKVQKVAGIGLLEWDLKTNRIFLSDEVRRLYGLDRQDELLTPDFIRNVVHPDDIEYVQKNLELALSGAVKYNIDHRILRPDGMILWVNAQAELLLGENGNPAAVIGTVWDITERKRAEEVLRESEEKFKYVFDHSVIGKSITLPSGEVRVNKAFSEMLGYSVEELQCIRWQDLTHPDDIEMTQREMDALMSGENESTRFTKRFLKKDGSVVWTDVSSSLRRDKAGKPLYFMTALSDITESKRAEETLRKSQAELRAILDATPFPIALVDVQDNKIDFWSRSALTLFGHTAPTAPEWYQIAYPDPDYRLAVIERWKPFLEEARLSGKAVNTGQYRVTCRNGSVRICELYAAFLQGRLIVTFNDITERKQAEEALRESEGRLRGITENIFDTILQSDRSGRITFVNRLHPGMSGEQVISSTVFDFVPPEQRPIVEKALTAVFERGEASQYESLGPGPDGESRVYDVSVSPIFAGDRIISAVFLARDITERKRAEEEKAKLETQLQQALKMESVGRLAGGVAHDFNNMLGVILGHAEMALEQVDPAQPLHADLTEIRKAAVRSADLTRQLLAFARKQTIVPKVLDLNETVAGMLKMLERLIGEDIRLDWQPGADLWPVRLDPSQIDQILANLCVNARDAIADIGRIVIETGNRVIDEEYCSVHAGFVPGNYVRLSVGDDGCGMDRETLANVFEPFFTTKEMGKGTGLGLATVYGAVKQNNGFIDVCSEPGKGTTFTIYLPRHAGKGGQAREEGAGDRLRRGNETILLVEDYPEMLKPAKMMLEMRGYTVLAAGTPGEAMRLAREHSGEIHLLMTDVVMPEMNGRDLARNLLSLYPGLKRLFMSGYPASVIAPHGVLEEGVCFIQKPFTTQSLTEKVREALDT